MLCSIGQALMKNLNATARERAAAEKELKDSAHTPRAIEARLLGAQKAHLAAGNVFVEHKAGCVTCRTSESSIRRRAQSPPRT
jgi:hypothetical protein